MSLVTEQGKAAQAEFKRLVKNIKRELLQFLSSQTMTVIDTIHFYNARLESHVREAVWELVAEKKIELTVDRKLVLVSQSDI